MFCNAFVHKWVTIVPKFEEKPLFCIHIFSIMPKYIPKLYPFSTQIIFYSGYLFHKMVIHCAQYVHALGTNTLPVREVVYMPPDFTVPLLVIDELAQSTKLARRSGFTAKWEHISQSCILKVEVNCLSTRSDRYFNSCHKLMLLHKILDPFKSSDLFAFVGR